MADVAVVAELHLEGAPVRDGEIRVRDLVVLTDALQELRLRIGREGIGTAGPGRTRHYLEELTEIRLSSIAPGSTVLTFTQGPTDTFDGILAEEMLLDQRFGEIVEAVGREERPEWATDRIAESAAKLVDGLKSSARRVVVRAGSGPDVTIETDHIHRDTWTSGRIQTHDVATAMGRLERVDLRTHEFRVRDDVGNAVDLRHVERDTVAGRLVGQWIVATGHASLTPAGRLVALDHAKVQEVTDPAGPYVDRTAAPVEELLASAPGPDPAGALDLDDDEFAAFHPHRRSVDCLVCDREGASAARG